MTDFNIDPAQVKLSEASAVQYYDAAARATLKAQFDIPDELETTIFASLEGAAANHAMLADQTPEARRIMQKDMEKLARTLSTGMEALENVSPELWHDLINIRERFDQNLFEYEVSSRWPNGEGKSDIVIDSSLPSAQGGGSLPLSELIAMLSSLSQTLKFAVAVEKSYTPRGRRSDWPFTQWLTSIDRIWRDGLGRKFTFDEMGGKAISPAAQFCVAAYAPLLPSKTEEQIVGKLRYFLSQRRQHLNWHK